MSNSGTLRGIIGTALLAAAPALFTAPAAAAPKTMIVLSSATYDSATLDDKANALATDAAGNVYVTGTSGNDYVSLKYTKTLVAGTPIAYTNGRGSNIPHGIAVDGLGNVIVAGEEQNAASRQAFLVLKYSPNFGAQVSSAAYDGGFISKAFGVKTDSQNNIYVAGFSNDGNTDNFYTIKYNSALAVLATNYYDSGDLDQAAGLALSGNNVIVAGMTKAGGTNDNFKIVRYDSDLKFLNAVSFDSGGNEKIAGVTVDSAGNIVVTGRQVNATTDLLTMKYDGFLTLISSAVFDSGDHDIPTGIAVDSSDNIIVTGYASNNYLTVKYDRGLNLISSATYDGGSVDWANAVAVDAEDSVLVTGQSYQSSNATYSYFTIKYNASPKITAVSPLYIGETNDVTLDGNGFVSGSSVAFTAAGISTGTIFYVPGQLRVAATLAPSVMLGFTPVTVLNPNGESVTSSGLASAWLRKSVAAFGAGALAAQARAGQVKVDIPAGTFQFQELVTIHAVPAVAGNPSPVGEALHLDVSPAGAVALQDIIITMHYSPADLGGYYEGSLSLAYLSTANVWVPLTTAVDQAGNSVSARTRVVNTDYAVVKAAVGSGGGGGGGAGGSGIPAKTYPNPYRPGSGGSFDQSDLGEGIVFAELEPGKSIKLTIVDVAGRLVFQKSGTADSQGRFLWDTKTASGGKAASGVYMYSITGGSKPMKGKVSIIR